MSNSDLPLSNPFPREEEKPKPEKKKRKFKKKRALRPFLNNPLDPRIKRDPKSLTKLDRKGRRKMRPNRDHRMRVFKWKHVFWRATKIGNGPIYDKVIMFMRHWYTRDSATVEMENTGDIKYLMAKCYCKLRYVVKNAHPEFRSQCEEGRFRAFGYKIRSRDWEYFGVEGPKWEISGVTKFTRGKAHQS